MKAAENRVGWLRIASAAQYLDVSVRTVRRLLREGLPHVKIPNTGTVLLKPEQIDLWLTRGQQEENHVVSEILANL